MTGGALLPWLIFSLGLGLKLWQFLRLVRRGCSNRGSNGPWNVEPSTVELVRASLERAWALEPGAGTAETHPGHRNRP